MAELAHVESTDHKAEEKDWGEGRSNPSASHGLVTLWWLILEFSSHLDLTTASAVSVALRADAQSDRLWLELVRRRWSLPRSSNTDPKVFGGSTWPLAYRALESAQRLPRFFGCKMRGDRIFARGRAGTRTNTPSLGSSGGGSGSLPVQVSSYSSGNVSADVWVGLHHSSNCHTRTATPPRTNPNTTTTTTTTNWPREEPRVSRKQALRQQYPRRLELRVLVQNTSGGPRPRPCSRHPFHGTVISTGSSGTGSAKISGSRCHSGMLKVVENNGSSSGSGGGVVMENGGDPFAVDWSHASVLFKTADGRLLALPVLKARLLGVNGKGVAKPSENDSYLHSHHCSKSNADYEVKDDDYFYDAPCDDENKVLGALDVALYSATVALPAEVMVEPEFLTRALELRLPLSLHTLVNQQQTTPLRHEQQRMKGAGGGDMGGSNAPKSSSSSRKLFGLAVAKFVDEVEVWEHYDELPGGFHVLRERGNLLD